MVIVFDVILLEKVGDVAVALTSYECIYPEKGLETHGHQGRKLAVVCSPEATKFTNERMILPPSRLFGNLFCCPFGDLFCSSNYMRVKLNLRVIQNQISEEEGVFERIEMEHKSQ